LQSTGPIIHLKGGTTGNIIHFNSTNNIIKNKFVSRLSIVSNTEYIKAEQDIIILLILFCGLSYDKPNKFTVFNNYIEFNDIDKHLLRSQLIQSSMREIDNYINFMNGQNKVKLMLDDKTLLVVDQTGKINYQSKMTDRFADFVLSFMSNGVLVI
jgi:hypothetical protein